jgi:ribosomal protein S18 acetylase RimI-like enzyme
MKYPKQLWEIYKTSFPPEERRNWQAQAKILQSNLYKLVPFYLEQSVAGFIAYWDLDSFVYIEHFAFKEELRGRGHGRRVLRELMERETRKIILEVELPQDEITKRRVRFYQSIGFHLNLYSYFQPPYRQGEKPIPMYLMSYPEPIYGSDLERIREKIYTTVYEYNL